MYKKIIITSFLAIAMLLGTSIDSYAGYTSWTNTYGSCSGSSSTSTVQYSGSPKYRIIKATTKCSNAAPVIATEVYGYVNGTKVLSGSNTGYNTTSVSASASSTSYVSSTVTGNGVHAVYSSTLARVNHNSAF